MSASEFTRPARRLLGGVGALALVVVLVAAWVSARPGEYSVMTMGSTHAGHGRAASHYPGTTSVVSLTADPSRPADVRVELVAREGRVEIPGGRTVSGYTVNGTSPGPTLRVVQGQLVEVTFVNESVRDGATLHWHGVRVPNAADGVAGVTQDAVPPGGRFVYRFVAEEPGTYWYHSHQISHVQVVGGLLGAFVVEPPGGGGADVVALLHQYAGQQTLNGSVHDTRLDAAPGATTRIRVINTDSATTTVWASGPFRVIAIDGHDLIGPTDVTGQAVRVAAGGRADIQLTTPADGSTTALHVGVARSIVVGPAGADAPVPLTQPVAVLDLLHYGSPADPGFDPDKADETFDYVIGRRLGLIDRRPGNYWTINGRMFPDVPMFPVRRGDVVRMRIENRTAAVHPMHLHGHHVLVLSRDGVRATGSPWWTDSLDVLPGEAYEIAFVADNPGIWMDHCHNLPHAVDGLVAHLMYEGVTTPFTIGGGNEPE